jgi:hypothetical protein
MRKVFSKSVPMFPDKDAEEKLALEDYPAVFELCKRADRGLYHQNLLEQLRCPKIDPIYEQFILRLREIMPLQIVTTNVDLCLEQQLGRIDVIERSDLERCREEIQRGSSFVAKLHGSISAMQSVVFATEDYRGLIDSPGHLAAVKAIFSSACVVFLGYGVRDKYVIGLLGESESEHDVFGSGPHFLVTSHSGPPEHGVHRIAYRLTQHPDHRAALLVLSVMQQAKAKVVVGSPPLPPVPIETRRESGFYVSDFKPSGTRVTGQSLELLHIGSANRIRALVGLGFAEGELPSSETVAFHDLAVGLICFDRVFLPLSSIGALGERMPESVLWTLVDSGAIRFVDVLHSPFFVTVGDGLLGEVGLARIQDPSQQEARSSLSEIRRMVKAVPGGEEQTEKRIERLSAEVVSFSDSEGLGLPAMVRDALLLPHVSELLGYSDYVVPNAIPKWLAYPTLRLAHLVQTALICNQLHIRASRVPFGGVPLLSAAFSIKPADQSAYEYASFVLGGVYGSNLSGSLERSPAAFLRILDFRATMEGEALRREVSDRLETNDGTEFSAAIEGSLKRAIPNVVLQAARNKFSTLLKTANQCASAAAVWSDSNAGDPSLRLWRERSRALLWEEARALRLDSSSPCMCGSGDRLRDCCLKPLR